jgi:hypothetical protein
MLDRLRPENCSYPNDRAAVFFATGYVLWRANANPTQSLSMNDHDPGLSAQEHDEREWLPRDVVLVLIAVIVTIVVVFTCCAGYPWYDPKPGGVFGF